MTIPLRSAVKIRSFTPADYPAFTRLKNSIYPEYATPEALFRHNDEPRDPRCMARRFMAEQDGRVIGGGEYSQNHWTYHPHRFEVDINVLPAYRRQGTGRALFHHVLQVLAPFNPQQLRATAYEDQEGGIAFLAHFGFVEVERELLSWLDPSGYDFSPYAGLEERLATQGIHLTTMTHLMTHDPEYKEKLYALDTGQGPEEADEVTEPAFDLYMQEVLDPMICVPDAFFVAVKDGRFIGMSNLESVGRDDRFMVGFTGVDPAFRRRGVALALKLRTIRYAVDHGNSILMTGSMSNNRPILGLNERLGFIRRPAMIRYHKDL